MCYSMVIISKALNYFFFLSNLCIILYGYLFGKHDLQVPNEKKEKGGLCAS